MSKGWHRRRKPSTHRKLTKKQIEKLRRECRILRAQKWNEIRKSAKNMGAESRGEKRQKRKILDEPGAIAENTVSEALAILKKDPLSRVWDFIHTSDLADKLLDQRGADFLVQLCRRPDDPLWVDYCTVLLQVKRSSGSRPHAYSRNQRARAHFKKHSRIPLVAVNFRAPERLARHIENYLRRFVQGKKLPILPPPTKNL